MPFAGQWHSFLSLFQTLDPKIFFPARSRRRSCDDDDDDHDDDDDGAGAGGSEGLDL